MRVVIADDAPLIREGVARLLMENGVEVVDQVGDADAVVTSIRDLRPDVALVDIRMPPTHTDEGLRAAREIRSRYPGTAVLVLSQHLEPDYALQLIEEKPERVGYLMKERVGRIERNLHDGAQQRLVTLSVALGLEASRADAAAADALSRAQDEVEETIAELRELARGIHPTLLKDEGLQTAVEALARRTPSPVTVRGALRDRLPDPVELAAYFVVAEALTNVVKHAAATEVAVLLEQEPDALRVKVTDDGVGGARITPESGLAGLRDRLEALDATMSIESEAGRGTNVCTVFPCAS